MTDVQIVKLTEQDVEKKLHDFSDLLKNIDKLDDKKRQLWKEIYENAISDRQNSYFLFMQLYSLVSASTSKTSEWAVHGKTLTSLIERMSRANEQLIRLAELIAKADEASSAINPNDLFDQIQRR